MPAFPRPPSFTPPISQTELGVFQAFLEKPHSERMKKKAQKRREMPVRRQSEDHSDVWGRVGWQVVEVFFAETLGTAMLLFFGCMGGVGWVPGTPLHPLQGAIVFAVVVATIIQIFGHISAAHLNPAVTIAFMTLGQVTPAMALVYVFSECVGAILGYGLLILLTPDQILSPTMTNDTALCCTVPHVYLTDVQAVAMEFFATCFLVMVVCACTDKRNSDKADSTPLKFACTILALSIAVGPYTGASMNPARSLGPALWTGIWTGQWLYWLGPCLSGFTTAIFYKTIFIRQHSLEASQLEEVPLNHVKVNELRTDIKEKSNDSR